MQFVQMYAGHPHFCIKTVPLVEIHQLQVQLKRGVIVEQFGCFNFDVWDEVDFCIFFKRHWKIYLIHTFFSVRSEFKRLDVRGSVHKTIHKMNKIFKMSIRAYFHLLLSIRAYFHLLLSNRAYFIYFHFWKEHL